jgi:ribose transport system ATP-binding protein
VGDDSNAYLQVVGLSKVFGATRALDDFQLDLAEGEVHALVGQNGSGKSTFIKILAGYHTPDAGTLMIEGRRVKLPITPRLSEACGLRFVHQNLALVPSFTVLETIRLKSWRRGLAPIAWRKEASHVGGLLRSLGADIDPRAVVADLSPSERSIVAIARALQNLPAGRAAIVLDEPTAALGKADADRLFETLRRLKRDGHAILFVSHRLDEVLAIADRVTVLRDGHRVTTQRVGTLNEADLIKAILGRPMEALYPEPPSDVGEAVLRVNGLTGTRVRDVSFTIARGEIVGLTGLAGMGHDEVPDLIYGARKSTGTIAIADVEHRSINPRRSRAAGVAFVPADRESRGAAMRATVAENITAENVSAFFRHGWLHEGDEAKAVEQLLQDFEVRPADPSLRFGALSGGNQQKTLLAKWLQQTPLVLLLHEPTQGIDVGSRQQVFRIIKQTAEAGAAVLVISTEYADLAHICNRVLVMRSGRLVAQLRGAELTEGNVIQTCFVSVSGAAA